MLTLYDFMGSGNGYKVRLLLAQLGLPYKRIECDILKGETRTPEFLAKNPNGRIPTLAARRRHASSPSRTRSWSYLAERHAVSCRRIAVERALMLQWMFFEQYSHEPNIAIAALLRSRTICSSDERRAMVERQARGAAILRDARSSMRAAISRAIATVVGERYSIADIDALTPDHAWSPSAEAASMLSAAMSPIRRWLEAAIAGEPRHIADHASLRTLRMTRIVDDCPPTNAAASRRRRACTDPSRGA